MYYSQNVDKCSCNEVRIMDESIEKDISGCEKLIMKIVWDAEEDISTMEIIDALKTRYGKEYARTTVVTFLQRLAEKGFVMTYRKGKMSYAHAIKKEKQYVRGLMQNVEEFWFLGDRTKLLSALYEGKSPTREEIEEIRKYLDAFDN